MTDIDFIFGESNNEIITLDVKPEKIDTFQGARLSRVEFADQKLLSPAPISAMSVASARSLMEEDFMFREERNWGWLGFGLAMVTVGLTVFAIITAL